ncbi:hypothetical protein PF003_g23527 [Phytophthora fragariae]|nr:hypothetical protein PF003_g23527 [Phytophthora fragariae]
MSTAAPIESRTDTIDPHGNRPAQTPPSQPLRSPRSQPLRPTQQLSSHPATAWF